jgi:hypothetical protein
LLLLFLLLVLNFLQLNGIVSLLLLLAVTPLQVKADGATTNRHLHVLFLHVDFLVSRLEFLFAPLVVCLLVLSKYGLFHGDGSLKFKLVSEDQVIELQRAFDLQIALKFDRDVRILQVIKRFLVYMEVEKRHRVELKLF